jgi:hypothetical protein
MNALHSHPKDAKEKIFGRIIESGEELAEGDVYNCPDGKWTQVPDGFAGCGVPRNRVTIFVRPAKGGVKC